MPALDPSGNGSCRPSNNASSLLSRNFCALLSGHTSAHPLQPHLPSPPPVTLVLAPSGNACDLPRVMPALAPPAIPPLSLFRDSCGLLRPGSDRHECCRRLRSRLYLRVVVVQLLPLHRCRRPLRYPCHSPPGVTLRSPDSSRQALAPSRLPPPLPAALRTVPFITYPLLGVVALLQQCWVQDVRRIYRNRCDFGAGGGRCAWRRLKEDPPQVMVMVVMTAPTGTATFA